MGRGLILLDRDGVLNRLVVDAEHGTIDSPLHPSQVQLLPGVPESLARLTAAGYGLAVVTNQPAWAKKKTTRENLEATHQTVIAEATRLGARILSSHMCLHRSEDNCDCRKPRPRMLRDAFDRNPEFDVGLSWMVGDGVTDVQAGAALGIRTAFLGPRKCDACKIMEERGLCPTAWLADLVVFTTYLLEEPEQTHGNSHQTQLACQGIR
jgi:D-glycero-D-manno-heptose 1,7-bisphosphate phosphatase